MAETKTLTLTIARHGETNFNVQKRLQGHMDVPLNEKGQKQAQAAGTALKDVKFHKAYSSDLARANLTCQLILSKNENSAIDANGIIQNQLIRERNFGEFEDKLVTEYEAQCAAVNMKKYEYTPKNGESREDVKARAKDFIQNIIAKEIDSNEDNPSILMVTHGGIIKVLNAWFFEELNCNTPENRTPGDHTKHARNTSWSRFELCISKDKYSIVGIQCQVLANDNHLENGA